MELTQGYTLQKVAGRSVLIPRGQNVIDGADIFTLNDTAKWVIENINDNISQEELCNRAAEEYEADAEEKGELNRVILSFLSELSTFGLIKE